jgi:UPF0755 protein
LSISRKILLAFLGLLLIGLVGAAVAWTRVHTAANAPGAATTEQTFIVPPGATLRSVLRALEKQQLIGSARDLEIYLRCCQRRPALTGKGIKAGEYRVPAGETPLKILQRLTDGHVVLEQITIVEGWTFKQMRRALAKHPKIQHTFAAHTDAAVMRELGQPGLHPEGRFAPDTYSFGPGTSDLQLLRMAFDAQARTLSQAWESRQKGLPLGSPEEALALASIVEKETGLASERGRVAGVYLNRLRTGMRLQSDPTVIYGIGDRYDGNIRRHDLTTDTPYNTYTRAGLPPTPIALPGRDAIVATLNPEKTDAIFFVAIGDGSGGHYFSATLAEHNRGVQRYLQRLRTDTTESSDTTAPGGAP